jgi:GPI mannosyltransferase 2
MLCYIYATQCRYASHSSASSTWTLLSGIAFGIATSIRSNGLLSGILFAFRAAEAVLRLPETFSSLPALKMLVATIVAGILVACGYIGPQIVAYREYCTRGNTRPWCDRFIPSIYGWVQDYYWEVGLFRYWTLNNLPLFLLAAPMLVVMLYTGFVALFKRPALLAPMAGGTKVAWAEEMRLFNHALPRFALPQLILAVMAATSFHVQIINRISSGYPVWYIILAMAINSSATAEQPTTKAERPSKKANYSSILPSRSLQWIVRSMAMYAIIQGGLYASFLPPA